MRLYFIGGASGSGKTAVMPHLKELLGDDIAVYDFDDIGVPEGADKKWRQESTEKWLQKLLSEGKDAKKAISDYKKATNDTISLIDLMVCYVEYGTDFLCEFGDMYEQYYCSLESVFSNTLKLMKAFEYQEVISFEQRLHVVVKKAEHMGWGYYDAISDMLNEAYPTSQI